MTKDKPTILVVDDDKNTRDGLERALRRRYDDLDDPGAVYVFT